MTLQGKVAIVTGGGRGIGESIALRLSHDGADVAIWDIRAELAEAVAAEVKAAGGTAIAAPIDVTNLAQVQEGCAQAKKAFGRVDILVNNAGWTAQHQFLKDQDPKFWRPIIDVDLFGVLNCTRAALEHMVAQQHGRIISIASDAAKIGTPGQSIYSSAKAAVMSFTRALAAEVGKHGITVNCVSPASTDTPLLRETVGEASLVKRERTVPVGRLGRPEEIAYAVAFLAKEESGYITGQTISVNGGIVRFA